MVGNLGILFRVQVELALNLIVTTRSACALSDKGVDIADQAWRRVTVNTFLPNTVCIGIREARQEQQGELNAAARANNGGHPCGRSRGFRSCQGRPKQSVHAAQEGCRRPDGRLTCCVGHAGADRNAAGWRAQACGAGRAGEEMQEARDGRLKIVDRETRDVHSVAWMLRRAVRPRGCRAQRSRAACPRQPGGPGAQDACRRPDCRLNRGTRDG